MVEAVKRQTDAIAEGAEVAPAVEAVKPGLGWRLRAFFLRHEPVRGYLLLSPTLSVMLLAMCLPLTILVAFSFWSQTYVEIHRVFTLENYETFFEQAIQHVIFFEKAIFPALLFKSIRISLTVTLATLLLAYPMAYFVAFRVTKHKILWIILMTVPFWTSYLLRVFAWKIILGYNGVINTGLMSLGFIDEPLQFLLYNPTSVVVTLAHAWAPWALLPIYVSLEKIDRSLLEAATDLGDGPAMRFLRVTLPLSMPGVIASGLLVFIPTVGDYVTPTLVGGTTGIMIGNIIQSQFGKANNWPMGAALSVVSIIIITLLVCAFLWMAGRWRRRRA